MQYLRIPGERIMKLAEELYQAGFISYPRTETDQFDKQYDLMVGAGRGGRGKHCVQWGWLGELGPSASHAETRASSGFSRKQKRSFRQ